MFAGFDELLYHLKFAPGKCPCQFYSDNFYGSTLIRNSSCDWINDGNCHLWRNNTSGKYSLKWSSLSNTPQ